MERKKVTKSELLRGLFKKHFLFFLLIPFVVITQLIILAPHLEYGFSDVDWGFLAFYKNYKTQYPGIFSNPINTFKHWGVYAHQSYYIGLQWELFGLNFRNFQLTTHIFKILATLATYPLFYAISGSVLAASISVILFAFAYPVVGTMYAVVTSSDYSAVLAMSLFLWFYWYIVAKHKTSFLRLAGILVFLLLTLFLSTERMYPILFLIPVAEILLYSQDKSRDSLGRGVKRLGFLYVPIILVFVTKPILFIDFVARNGGELGRRVLGGDWHVLLTPFISLGSTVIPHTHWKYFGIVNLENFVEYIKFLIGPTLIFGLFTIIIASLIFKRPWKFVYKVFVFPSLFGILSYIVATRRVTHFDSSFISPALIGSYLISFSFFAFREWQRSKEKLLIGVFAGPILAFIYIFLTWLAAETFLIFAGTHRYLTLPAMAISFFLACLIMLVSKGLWSRGNLLTKSISLLPFFAIISLVTIGINEINAFFENHLYHGFGAADQQLMRGQLNSYLDDLSAKNPSLFYFDYSEDHDRGYYYDNTLLGGFKTWMLFHDKINLNENLRPALLFQPPSGLDILKKSVVKEKNQIVGFSLDGKLYGLDNFYSFKLKEKKVVDSKMETLRMLEL